MSTPPTVHDSDRKAAEEIHRIVARSFDVPNHVETSNSSTYLALIIARHHAEERAAVEKAADLLEEYEGQIAWEAENLERPFEREKAEIKLTQIRAALTALRNASARTASQSPTT